ncbi:MAG: potassium transporter TrkG [Pseudomonadota bacterium]
MGISLRLLQALGWCWLIVGGFAAPLAAGAAAEGAGEVARGFALTAAAGVFLGGLSLTSTRGAQAPADTATALRLLLYGWLTTPVLAAPALIASTGGFASGLFESFSALTTTGASVVVPEDAPRSIVLWRGLLQWLGGLASLVLAVTVLATLDAKGPGLRRSTLLTVEGDDVFTNFGRAIRRIGSTYLGLTILGVGLLMATGAQPFSALTLAMSAISTGGMTPQSGPLGDWLPLAAILVTALICLSGAWSMALQYELVTRRRLMRSPGDLRAMMVLALAGGVAAAVFAGAGEFPMAALDAWFAVTTAGFSADGAAHLPAIILVTLALIGGSAVSTTGGVKIPRVLLLARRAREELILLSHPSAAVTTRFAGRPASDAALLSVAVYALAYPLAMGAGALLIGAAGADFSEAWLLSGAALANAGPLTGADYASLPDSVLYVLIPVMIVGRLEVVAFAAALFVIFTKD